VELDACPFCGGQVDRQIVLYGGSCPRCFADIPGEEAATDPGEHVKQKLAQQDQKRASRRTLLPMFIATPVVVALVGLALWLALRPEPELAVLDLDDGVYYTPDLDQLVIAQVGDPEKQEAVEASGQRDTGRAGTAGAAASGSANPSTEVADAGGAGDAGGLSEAGSAGDSTGKAPKIDIKRPNIKSAEGEADLLANLSGAKVDDSARGGRISTADKGARSDLSLDVAAGVSTSGLASGGLVDIGSVSQELPTLSNPQQIAEMVQSTLRKNLPRLRTCCESSLRGNPGLMGKWVLTFTVETDGRVSQMLASGEEMRDAAFEECLTRKMAEWRFQKVSKAQPVKKTVDFTR